MKLASVTQEVNFQKTLEMYLSKRRRVESKQLANMQLPSLDNDIQLTGCPKSSDISLVDKKENNSKISLIQQILMQQQELEGFVILLNKYT